MRKYSSSPLSSLLSRGSHASSAESASFEDFPSGILYPLASLSLLTRVIFMTCSYLHIPSVSKIGFPSKVRQDIPQVQWDALILKQDSFPKQSSHPDLIVSSRFLIRLCQLAVCDFWSLILSSPQSSMLSSGLLQQISAPPLFPQAASESCIICIAFSKACSVFLLGNVIPYTFIHASCIKHIISVSFYRKVIQIQMLPREQYSPSHYRRLS